MCNETISWLHLSDLHLKNSYPYVENIVLQTLISDIKEYIRRENLSLNFIAVTGDIAFSGQSTEYAIARSFFDELLRITSVPKSKLFLIPGNHDINRELIPVRANSIFKTLNDSVHVHDFFENAGERELIFRPFKGYAEFINDYLAGYIHFDDEHYYYVQQFEVSGRQISILGLNSAWFGVSHQDTARGLLIGGAQSRAALEETTGADVKIALVHHPISWLRRFDQKDSGVLLNKECDFILQGHLHHTSMTLSNTSGHNIMTITGGACFKTRRYLNQYNLVKYNPVTRNGLIYFRKFLETPGGFWVRSMLKYTNAPDGVFPFKL